MGNGTDPTSEGEAGADDMPQDEPFLVIPAVSLQRGRVVVINQGEYEPLTDLDDRELTLYDFTELFLEDFGTVMVLDIDGIERRRPQLTLMGTIAPIKNVWWDPGVRNLEDMMDAFTAGANRVVVGTKTVWNLAELRACQEFSRDWVLSLDWADGILSRDAQISQADPIDFLKLMYDEGLRRVMFSQYGPVRSGSRIDMDFVREMDETTRRLYLGGSGFDLSTASVVQRAGLGVRGIVVGVMDIIRESIVQEEPQVDEGSVLVGRY
jgi:phosphoribosylformimino-5-aminoimidazole carboxamide ribonucleotide (ProFAR) isomerase